MNTFLSQWQPIQVVLIILLSATFLFVLPNIGTSQCFLNTTTNQYETVTGEPCVNTIITAVPFLRIAPDARSAGMGDAGLAVSKDANAIHFNASKLVFAENRTGLSLTYTPWLSALELKDVYLGYLSGYHQINEAHAIGLSIRYFSLGETLFTDENGIPIGNGKSNEVEFNASFAKKIGKNFSGGFGLKYIYSNLASGLSIAGTDISAGKSIAMDFSFTYQTPNLTVGLAATNLGQKITYTNSINKDFIPTNLGIGVAWNKYLGETTRLTLTTDINKLMAPTPDPAGADEDFDGVPDYKQVSTFKGIFGSFSDAPGGFSEEMRELMFSFGAELIIKDNITFRTGYFAEHSTKGNRKYFTTGLGYTYKFVTVNGSYLIPSTSQKNPLKDTFRVSVLFNFGQLDKVKNS